MTARTLHALLLLGLCAATVRAAEPAIRNLDIRGLRIGGATTLTIDGDDFGKTPRLLLPFAAKQILKPGSTDKKAIFEVALDPAVEPGYHQLRIVAEGGVSLPIVIAVDRMPQQIATAPVAELPVALHGTINGGTTAEFKFTGKAKQRVLIDVESHRLGSKLRPVVHLYDARKLQLAWAWPSIPLHSDCRLEATLPADGAYTVALHDVEYAGPNPGFYRLKIGQWSYVDRVFPNVISKSQPTTVNLLGMSDTPTPVNPPKSLDAFPLAWPKGADWSGPRPFVAVSPFPEFTRQPGDKPQELPAGMVGVSGKLLKPYDEDRYKIPVTPGKKVKLEVFAERIGSPIDVAVVVRNEKGDQLARGEDSPGTLDPVLEYAVPDKVTSIIVGVADAQGRAGPGAGYRLVVNPLTSANTYRLTTPIQRLSLVPGRRVVVPVQVERQGYPGKIDLALSLPPGVKAENTSIPDGADGTLVTLERSAAAFEPMIATWRGRGVDGVEQAIAVKGHPLKTVQPWLAREIAVAASNAKPIDFAIDWRKLPADTAIVPGIKLPLPITVKRALDKTTVKLTLLTTQVPVIVNNQPDPNKLLRQEKPIEMPVKGNESELVVLVPTELAAPMYDVTVQAELLDPAKKVLATEFTPVRRMAVRVPIVVKLNGPNRIEAPFDPKKGAVVKLQGKIERIPGIKGDVALAITGLPAGAKADAVTVKADASDFAVNVTFPPNVAPGEFKNVKLSGSFAPDAKTPNIRVKSREIEVNLVLSKVK